MLLRRPGPTDQQIARQLIRNALVNINGDNIVTSAGAVSEMLNQGTGGAAYDLDVVLGTAANGKAHPSETFVLFGANGDHLTSPDSAASDIDGNLTIIAKLQLDDYTPATEQVIYSQYLTTGNQRAIFFALQTDGKLTLILSDDGTFDAGNDKSSSVAITAVDGNVKYVKLIWVAATGVITFSTSDDGETFDTLGTTQTTTTTTIHNSTTNISVGAESNGTGSCDGAIHWVEVYDGASLVIRCDAADQTNDANGDTATFVSAATSETWTQVGDCYAQNTGHTLVQSIGSYALEVTTEQPITGKMTIVCVARYSSVPSADAYLYDAHSDATNRAAIFTSNAFDDTWVAFQGSSLSSALTFDQEPHIFTFQANQDSSSKITVSSLGSVTGDAGSEDYDYGTIGAAFNGSGTLIGAYYQYLLWDYQLSAKKLKAVVNEVAREYRIAA